MNAVLLYYHYQVVLFTHWRLFTYQGKMGYWIKYYNLFRYGHGLDTWQLLKRIRGRSQLSTFMKAYTAYARGEGVWDHRTLFPQKSTFIFNHWQCIITYCTCLECGQYAHICRSFMYNNTFEAIFLTSKCTKRGFLWTQTVAPHRGFCKPAQRRYRIFCTWADSSSQNRTKLRIFH